MALMSESRWINYPPRLWRPLVIWPFWTLWFLATVTYASLRDELDAVPLCKPLRELCDHGRESSVEPEAELALLSCLHSLSDEQLEVAPKTCETIVWKRISIFIKGQSFREVIKQHCAEERILNSCFVNADGFLGCIFDSKDNLRSTSCRIFVEKLEWLAFSDFRMLSFIKNCGPDVDKLSCGRLAKSHDETAPQGETIACLQTQIENLNPKCKREIFHLTELQGDNIKLDRQLSIACADDRLRFCSDLSSESSFVYKCLMLHKTDRAMSKQCQNQLSRRQKLMMQDYKISKGLSRACKDDIRSYRCRRGVSEDKDIRLAQILLCLEGVLRNNSQISTECRSEMVDHRKMLMEDFHLSPEIVRECAIDIDRFCSPIEIGGKTIHCLMEHARQKRRNMKINISCQRALENLIKETDAGEDWRVDPVLRQSCKSVVDTACKEISGGDGRVMSCLVEKLKTSYMTEECSTALMQIQYFIVRDFKLDPQLYKACKNDAVNICHAKKGWIDEEGQMDPERGPSILPCLYRYAYQNKSNIQLSLLCLQEVKRVMRQRAVSVHLQPEIEEVCLDDLASRCNDKTDKGEEMSCLQTNFDILNEKCRIAVGNFTETQAGHVELNPIIMKHCQNAMERFCSMYKNGKDEGDVIDCLISHKNDPGLRPDIKCRAAVEHFQLISLKNYHFTYKFKDACESYVTRYCPLAKTKNEVITCLSETVRNNTIDGSIHTIPKECRQQLRYQLFQQRENIEFDPNLLEACKFDLKEFCPNIEHGGSQALECLQNLRGRLSMPCQRMLFNIKRQESADNAIDYNLITTCSSMITLFCHATDPSKVLDCLKVYKEETVFDEKCKLIVVHRMIDQNSDYRFNPAIQSSCKLDIKKFCLSIIAKEQQDKMLEGKVLKCLKSKFRESKLSSKCEHQVAAVLREQALNYHLDPLLSTMCSNEIETICKPNDNSETAADGEVEECLKQAFLHKKIVSEECRREIAELIDDSKADIQADPLLQRACRVDLLKWCNHIEPGDGRHIKCLQRIFNDDTKQLEKECETDLSKRMEMFKSAAIIMVPEDFQDLYDQVIISPAKKYFLVMFFSFVGCIFMIGLYCGKVTRKDRYMKKK